MNDSVFDSDLESAGDGDVDAAFDLLARGVAAVNSLDLTALVRLDSPSVGLHAAGRNLELLRRKLAVFDCHYVTAVEVGDEPARYARPSTAAFLREQLRLSGGEAKRRVDLAHAITPEIALTGEVLPPALPALADAVASGVVSGDHARTIVETIDKLPSQVREAHGAVVEAEMVTAAAQVTPADLDKLVPDIMLRADPDGVLREVEHAHTNRGLHLWKKRGQAGYTLHGDLDQETGELAQVVLGALSKPVPAADATADLPDGTVGARDERSLQVRQHDGFRDALTMVANAGDLPACGGTPATTVWHIDKDELRKRHGLAVSEHGTLIPVGDALRSADQSAIQVLVEDSKGVPLYLARTTRIATPGQTAALAARDRGCSFPGCDRPPSHCQRHHIRDWASGGPTDVDNLTLVCGYHHREFPKRGWECVVLNGLPHWRPPAWLDPHRQPIRNTRHFTLPRTGTDTGTTAETSSTFEAPEGWLPDTG